MLKTHPKIAKNKFEGCDTKKHENASIIEKKFPFGELFCDLSFGTEEIFLQYP